MGMGLISIPFFSNTMITDPHQISGWMSEKELAWLSEFARNANIVVEFGCYLGRSTRALADACKGTVYAVDPWDGKYYKNDNTLLGLNTAVFDIFKENLKDHIDSGKVVPIKDYSWAFNERVRADLVFIDGDHRYEEVKNDILTALRIVKSNGVISGHDYTHVDWPGVKQAVDEMLGKVNHCESIWWTKIW